MAAGNDALRVFVSYARLDGSALADELAGGLELLGFTPVIDRQDIAAAEDWERRLDTLIGQADTVLFLLSPQSVRSARCGWEVDRAVALHKRIVPVVVAPVPEEQVPEALRKLHFIDFGPGRSFSRALAQLGDALRLDLEWIREHTRIGGLAARWSDRGHDEALLLRGAELEAAEAWAARWHAGAPVPTDLQRRYIAASAEAAATREHTERRRVEEMAVANASRAEALTLREQALRTLRRRTLVGAVSAGALSVGISALALLYWRERKRAEDASAQSLRDATRREALRTDLEGQVAAYAALPGKPAMDDSGFTKGLIEQLSSQEVSLGVALARTVRRVIEKTGGAQRPYIATDMNGDVYFRIAPRTRVRKALVVTVEQVGGMELPGARADGQAWNDFLVACGFEVRWLRGPTRDEVMAALYGSRTAALSVGDPPLLRPVGLRPLGAGAAASGAAATDDARPKAAPNTFYLLYFAGSAFHIDDLDYLAMADTPMEPVRDPAAIERITASSLSVAQLSTLLRGWFAASCLILDTGFMATRRQRS